MSGFPRSIDEAGVSALSREFGCAFQLAGESPNIHFVARPCCWGPDKKPRFGKHGSEPNNVPFAFTALRGLRAARHPPFVGDFSVSYGELVMGFGLYGSAPLPRGSIVSQGEWRSHSAGFVGRCFGVSRTSLNDARDVSVVTSLCINCLTCQTIGAVVASLGDGARLG